MKRKFKEIHLIDAQIRDREIYFKFSGLEKIFNVDELSIKYDEKVDFLHDDVLVNMFLSFTLPFLAHIENNNITLTTKLKIHNDTKIFWEKFINKVQCRRNKEEFILKLDASSIDSHEILYDEEKASKIAVLYGGGVESNYALASLVKLSPLLIVFEGKNFMNNRTGINHIKLNLLNQMCKENNLIYRTVYVPFQEGISLVTEVDFNNYAMGLMFYFLSLPIAKTHNISIIFNGQEQEDINCFHSNVTWDYSYSAHLINQVHISQGPLIKNFGGYSTKCGLIYTLYHLFPEFYKYIYSCYCCGSERWEGKCLKCNRIAYYCNKLKLDKKIIELPESITGETIKEKYKVTCDKMAKELGLL